MVGGKKQERLRREKHEKENKGGAQKNNKNKDNCSPFTSTLPLFRKTTSDINSPAESKKPQQRKAFCLLSFKPILFQLLSLMHTYFSVMTLPRKMTRPTLLLIKTFVVSSHKKPFTSLNVSQLLVVTLPVLYISVFTPTGQQITHTQLVSWAPLSTQINILLVRRPPTNTNLIEFHFNLYPSPPS